MNPFQKNKVDMNALSPEEQKAFRLYGKLPNRKDVMQNKLKERKYFDSGDYYLSKAGQSSEISPTDVGREHPVPENIPHLTQSPSGSAPHPSLHPAGGPGNGAGGLGGGLAGSSGMGMGLGPGASGSPVKESSFLSRGESIDDVDDNEGNDAGGAGRNADADAGTGVENRDSISPPPKREGVPVPVRPRGTAPTSAGSSGLR